MTLPFLYSGGDIAEEGGPRGTIALLAGNSAGAVFALTAFPVLPARRRASVPVGGRTTKLAMAGHVIEPDPNCPHPIVSVLVPDGVMVAANAGGLAEASGAVDIVDAFDVALTVHLRSGRAAAQIVGYGHRTRLTGFADNLYLEDLVEIDPVGRPFVPRDGDAGALVTAAGGGPVGLIVAARKTSLLMAPIAPFLRDGGLRPLTAFDAAAHNAQDRPEVKTKLPPPASRVQRPNARSADLLEAAGLDALLKELAV